MRRGWLLVPVLIAGCVPVPPPGARPRATAPHRATRPLPPPPAPLPATAAQVVASGRYPTLAAAIRSAGLAPLLAGPGPLTLFAPDERAWARLAPGILADLLKPGNRGSLTALLRFHLVPGRLTTADLRRRAASAPLRLPTLAGEPLTVTLAGDTLMLGDATGHRAEIVGPDEAADNGGVTALNGLLVPQALGPQP